MADFNTRNPANSDRAQDIIYGNQNTGEAKSQRDLIEGRRYTTGYTWPDSNTTNTFLLENDSSDYHLFVSAEVYVGAKHTLNKAYNPTIDDEGESVIVQPNRSNGAAPDTMNAYRDVSTSDAGDEFPDILIGAGDTPNRYQFGVARDISTLVRPNDSVLFNLENTSGGNNDAGIVLEITEAENEQL